ncbi:MAG: DUF2065 family protein [Betaproteobacteria bacterium]
MAWDTLWVALALVLIFEGCFPMISPKAWRRMFEQILQLEDGQIRFFGLTAIGLGVFLLLWVL